MYTHFFTTTLVCMVLRELSETLTPIPSRRGSGANTKRHRKRAELTPKSNVTERLSQLGSISTGVNSNVPNGQAWFGNDTNQNQFENMSGEDLILVIWSVGSSWVNVHQPLITALILNGTSEWMSFANGATGAWSAIYSDTVLVNGQISNTWGEYTFGEWGTVDVSREVNMNGHPMSIVTPTCVSDMETCVFVCSSGDVCTFDYKLQNCENGSQPGASYGIHMGSPSGGCSTRGLETSLLTTFG